MLDQRLRVEAESPNFYHMIYELRRFTAAIKWTRPVEVGSGLLNQARAIGEPCGSRGTVRSNPGLCSARRATKPLTRQPVLSPNPH